MSGPILSFPLNVCCHGPVTVQRTDMNMPCHGPEHWSRRRLCDRPLTPKPHFRDRETEAQRDEEMYPRSCGQVLETHWLQASGLTGHTARLAPLGTYWASTALGLQWASFQTIIPTQTQEWNLFTRLLDAVKSQTAARNTERCRATPQGSQSISQKRNVSR